LQASEIVLAGQSEPVLRAPANTTAGSPANQRHFKVLLAEDNLVNQKVAVRFMEKRGHGTVVAESGKQALAAWESQFFDLILMDVQMPEMGGFEATAAIRQEERKNGRHIPIIAMTAHAMKGDRERCLAAGMDAYLSKPIDASELFELIESITPDRAGKQHDPVDTPALLARVDGDMGFLRELIALFLDDCPKMLARIRDAIGHHDAEALRSAAHALKGSVANFSAPAAVAAALNLETLGREARLAEAEAAYRDFEIQVEQVERALREVAEAPDRRGDEESSGNRR
jgi:two-component system sensor histidine kinase/response regulator